MSTDIIPAPIRVCPKGQTNSLANRVHPAEHSMSETWYNVDRHYTVHLISAFTAESQALESAGGTMAACGHGIMSPDIVPVHLVSAFTAESQALESAGGTMAACGHGIMSINSISAQEASSWKIPYSLK